MFRIFGPPGTGKTTTLLNLVDQALADQVPPNQIAFLSFTKKAATEARYRAAKRFNLDAEHDLVYFRTLHSLSYRLLGLRNDQQMKTEHFHELSNHLGIQLVRSKKDPFAGDGTTISSSDHPILSLINLARLRKISIREQYNQSNIDNVWEEVSYVDRAYQKYKEANGLLDYTDTLVMFAENMADHCPRFKVCFLDEAQDLSPLQWDIAHGLDEHSEKMYCAGDDDQAIYRWAGADINQFIHLPGGSETLEQSYRIPQSVHTVADKIVARITDRYPKQYRPRQEKGTVERIYDLSEADLSHGSWLILTQANYMLDPLDTTLRSMGYLFERPRQRSISEKLSEAVNGWEALRKGNEVSLHTAQCVYGYMTGNGVRVTRGHKKILEDETAMFTLEKLQKQHGLLASEDQIWHEAMDKLPDADRAYIVALLRRGEKFNAQPRIRLSTIHQAKGGEADNVVLFSDLAPAAARDFNNDTHRVFYVGVTRTRQNLYIVEPENLHLSYLL